MTRPSSIHLLFTLITLQVISSSCANIGRPSGGEKDTKGPEMIGAIPFPGTLNFSSDQVVFYFDEFLKAGSYRNEIFISPVPPVDPEITVKNKTLKIKFLSPLREKTTYVITLGTGIADFNEGNKMEKSYTYAFSTGDVLDSLRFSGQVTDMWTGTGDKDFKVMLYRDQEIQENDFNNKRPEYVAVTDNEGKFDFQFLAAGSYRILAVKDANNDFKYSGPSEKIGIAESSLVELKAEDSLPLHVSLVTFLQDLEGPKVKSARWANDYTIHVEFSEPIRPYYGQDSLYIELTDSAGGEAAAVEMSRFKYRDKKHLYLHAPKPRTQNYKLHFRHLMDSLGQGADTAVMVNAQSQVREEKGKWVDAPINLPTHHDFVVPTLFLWPDSVDSSMVQLRDTSGNTHALKLQPIGFELFVKPEKILDPQEVYLLEFRKNILLPDGKYLDTLLQVKVRFPDPKEFGTISGKILPDSTRPDAKLVALFRGPSGTAYLMPPDAPGKSPGGKGGNSEATAAEGYEQRFTAPATFKFLYLHPGKYTLDIIDDADGNGVLTPGSLSPYRLPEKTYHLPEKFDIRAKWDFENVEIYPIPSKAKGKATEGEKGTESDDSDAANPSSPNPKGGK